MKLLPVARLELLAAMREAESSIWLASPFISLPVARVLVDAAKASGAQDLRLLTALDPRSVCAGVLDPEALRALADGGFTVKSIGNLHAKVALVDGSWALVGSGNLTNAGIGSEDGDLEKMNVELGVTLARAHIGEAVSWYEDWWARADAVTGHLIDEYDALERWRPPKVTPPQGTMVPVFTNERMEQILAEDDVAAGSRSYWMKAAYFRPGQDEDGWWTRGWISDRRSPPYAVGDLIVLYLGGRGAPRCCPAVLEIRSTRGYAPDFVEANGEGPVDRKWPWVTHVSTVFHVPIRSAPPTAAFGIDARSTQNGYRGLTRAQFESAVRAMSARSGR